MIALAALVVLNLSFSFYSHSSLRRSVQETEGRIIDIVVGRVREVGPVEAQETALRAQAVEKATRRAHRPATLNL